MHHAGASALSQLLQFEAPDADHLTVPCLCGHTARFKEMRAKSFLSVVGPVEVRRPYYLCSPCSKGQHPVDVELGIAGLESSPGVRRMEAMLGAEMPFVPAREPMKVLAGLEVPAKAIERAAEGIGAEIARIEGQRARTRECKLGAVFTQTTVDKDGWPLREPDSTSYVGAVETADEFGYRIYTEAWRRGWEWATTKIVIGDGAVWIWNLANQHFPGAVQIVDLYHARQHLWHLAALLYPHDTAAKRRWMVPMKDLLDHGRAELLVEWLREIAAAHAGTQPGLAEEISKQAEYFDTNTHRMQYPEFREQGLFVGSGVIEAGCKSIVGVRLKQSGMFWTVRGANAIIALRCCRFNQRFEDFWAETRAA